MPLLTGLRTVVYYVEDLEAAKAWWTGVLGTAPHFESPFYVGFNAGGYELGLQPKSQSASASIDGIAYWGVVDIDAAFEHFKAAGATVLQPVEDVGGGIKVATLTAPSGNVVGLILNPHFSLPAA
jgi:predicted enzyme related to lactoylglutathione lyase